MTCTTAQPQKSQQTHHYQHTHTHTKHTRAWSSKRKWEAQIVLHWSSWRGGDGETEGICHHPSTTQSMGPEHVWKRKEVATCCWEEVVLFLRNKGVLGRKCDPKGRFSASLLPTSHGWGLKARIWLKTLL